MARRDDKQIIIIIIIKVIISFAFSTAIVVGFRFLLTFFLLFLFFSQIQNSVSGAILKWTEVDVDFDCCTDRSIRNCELRLVSASATTGLFSSPAARLPLGRHLFLLSVLARSCSSSRKVRKTPQSTATAAQRQLLCWAYRQRSAGVSISQPKSQSH